MKDDNKTIRDNWQRYQYAKDRGHESYIIEARKNEDMYLGGGLQWDKQVKAELNMSGRPVVEKNYIWPVINTADGLQIQSRVQMAFRPRRNGADEETAEVLSKLVRQICDDTMYSWHESTTYQDGLVQQRGYLEFRMDFDTNLSGDIKLRTLDPLDVIPDPDANSYDPEDWQDIVIVKWLTIDDISQLFGQKKADEVENVVQGAVSDPEDDYSDRSRFGSEDTASYLESYTEESGIKRVLVIDRQSRRLERQKVLVYPFGDIVPAESMTEEAIQGAIEEEGAFVTKRMVKRIRWTVSTADVLLHDDWSPYRSFTVIPFFPYFRRGRTRGMVDNLRSPQEMNNKLESQIIHILNTTANSGWLIPTGSLINMVPNDMQNIGAKTGLCVEYDPDKGKPEKINSNQLPTGLDRLVERSEYSIKQISGITDAVQGQESAEVSGKARHAAQYAGQTQLARPIDNLAKTRHFAARKYLELIQDFYTEERVFMISGDDISGTSYDELTVNQSAINGEVINDLTLGEYDVVITDQSSSATFMDTQYQQAKELRESGVSIPDEVMLEVSSLSKKHEVMEAIANQAQQPDPEAEAKAEESISKAELNRANTEKVKADTVGTNIKTQYSAVQSAGAIVQQPGIAPIADTLLKSGGYIDHDLPPIVPNAPGMINLGAPPTLPANTDPLSPAPLPMPASPMEGQASGIETQRFNDNL